MPEKKIITLYLDSDVISSLKSLGGKSASGYANQMLRKVLGLEDDANELVVRVEAVEDFLSDSMGYQRRASKKGLKFAK